MSCPVGTPDNSPAIYRWVGGNEKPSSVPEGRLRLCVGVRVYSKMLYRSHPSTEVLSFLPKSIAGRTVLLGLTPWLFLTSPSVQMSLYPPRQRRETAEPSVAQRTLGSGQIRTQTPTGFYNRHGVHWRREGRRRLIGHRRGVDDCVGTANVML